MEEVHKNEPSSTRRFLQVFRPSQAPNYRNKSHLGTGSQLYTDMSGESGVRNTPACCVPNSKR